MNTEILVAMTNDAINQNYLKLKRHSIQKRYQILSKEFEKILRFVEEHFYNAAKEYYKKRSKNDQRLQKIQTNAIKSIKACLKVRCIEKHNIDFEIKPVSSFSGRLHLIGESDLDIAVFLKNVNETNAVCVGNALGRCNYVLNDIRNAHDRKLIHWVYQKYVNNVEIEVKVRDGDGFKEFLKMHDYIDHKMPKKAKVLTTYGKFLLKNDKEAYSKFKMLYYCNAGYHSKTKKLLYPLL